MQGKHHNLSTRTTKTGLTTRACMDCLLTHGWIGSSNIQSNSRCSMHSSTLCPQFAIEYFCNCLAERHVKRNSAQWHDSLVLFISSPLSVVGISLRCSDGRDATAIMFSNKFGMLYVVVFGMTTVYVFTVIKS